MSWIDWCITLIPMALVIGIAYHSRTYIRGVVDYLAAGRVAGRYVLAIGDLQGALSVITLVALVEAYYQTGIGISYWSAMTVPIGMLLSLTGFVVYRFRETRALSFGQFLEMRYNRSLRIFAAILRTISEMLTNAIGPAIAARFFIYYLGFKDTITIGGVTIQTFVLVLGIALILALIVLLPGGRISLVITDCIQGLLCYPIFVLIIIFVFMKFSWFDELAPVLLDRAPGESFLNPFDVSKLRDFNVFALVVGLVASILNRASWMGNDSSSAGRTAHEQKMASILGTWRYGFTMAVLGLIGFMMIGLMNHRNFAEEAREIRMTLSQRVDTEVAPDPTAQAQLMKNLSAIPLQEHRIGTDLPLSQQKNLDTPWLDTAHEHYGKDPKGNYIFQKFRTLFYQMMLPISLRKILPVGMVGLFALLMLMLLVSTDDTRIFNSASTIIQDIVVPLCRKPISPQAHVKLLKISSIGVGIFFFVSAMLFTQLDYINMFITIMAAIWLGGAGPVMLLGLYTRFGTTAGAFSSIFLGSGIAITGMTLQANWAEHVYPYLENHGWTVPIGNVLEKITSYTSPYVVWKMDPVKFPINSMEIYFIAMMTGLIAYIIVSLLTCRKLYDLDRLLHRGKYRIDGVEISQKWTWKNAFSKIIGITPEYTKGDRIMTYGVFCYSFIWSVVIAFLGTLIWNFFSPLPPKWWNYHFFITLFGVTGVIGMVSTVWFLIGGIIDMKRLFKDLKNRVDNPLDNGTVVGQISLADANELNQQEQNQTKEGK